MLDYALIEAVSAVLREGSFERAAHALGVTPSAVSQRVKLIEERMGTALIVRGQPCAPTDAGARLCRHAERVAMLEADLRHELPAVSGLGRPTDRPVLPIAVNADSLATWFVDVIADAASDGAPLLDVSIDDQDHTAEWLQRGRVLAAVTSTGTALPGCRSRRLGALRYRATASPAFVRRWFADGVTARTLAAAPCLVFDRKDRLQHRWAARVARREVELAAHRLPSANAFVAAALAGVGWGMNPEPLVAAHLKAGRLVELVPDAPMDVALHWQVARVGAPLLERLGARVAAVATGCLVG
ncbi:MAG: LysR family transcriptional regulator ArgP [Burkholderiales bacterium]